MAVTGIVNAEDVPEPPYPDVMDIYYRMKMIGFRFWGDGLDSQPYVLYYEMQIVNTLLETFEKVNSKAQYESLLKGLTNAK